YMHNMRDYNLTIMRLIKNDKMKICPIKRYCSLFVLVVLTFISHESNAQLGLGIATNYDLYQRFTNPEDNLDQGRSAGSALTSFAVGPKIWIGKPAFSFSVEALAGIGLLTLDVSKFKGIGSTHFPIIGSFNFNGASGLGSELKKGFSLGGGIQYNRTELFGVTSKYKSAGVERN